MTCPVGRERVRFIRLKRKVLENRCPFSGHAHRRRSHRPGNPLRGMLMGRQQWQQQRCGTVGHDMAKDLVCRVGALSSGLHELAKEVSGRLEMCRSSRENGLEARAYEDALNAFVGKFPLAQGRTWRTDVWNFWHLRRTKWLYVLQKAFYGWRARGWHSRATSNCNLILTEFAATYHLPSGHHKGMAMAPLPTTG